ncbi:MAG: phosphoenolpyruvate carboxykinase (ATP), partial [Acidobacteria bacterium]|nr:phosphoenolpyruvate carboxykinase (ATP) [Acidobacteriota bacterium]
MSINPYDPKVYKNFAENLKSSLKGRNIEHLTMEELRKKALKTARFTSFGAPVWYSKISSRMAAKTVYLGGGPEIVLPKPTKVQLDIVEKAPEQLNKVLELLKTMPFVHIKRQMGDNSEYNPICNIYVCVADPKNYRLAYEWAVTMGDVKKNRPGPEFIMIDIPEEHLMRLQILTIPEHNINIALGSDYTGECKKGFLRQAMYSADLRGMLGLHAGTKIVKALDQKTGKLKQYGVFMFGLTATGKSTWSCHQLGFDHKKEEGTFVAQDDIVFLKKDGSAYGSEQNYYVKTDVDKNLQEAMYHALCHKTALLENVMID